MSLIDMPEAKYHGDPCERPSLNSTVARALVSESPAHARLLHPRLSDCAPTFKPEFDFGTAGHTLLLKEGSPLAPVWIHNTSKGVKPDYWRVPTGEPDADAALALSCRPADSWRTGVAREAREQLRGAGKVPLLPKDYEVMKEAVDAWRKNLAKHEDSRGMADPIVIDGECEKVAIFDTPTSNGELVRCRARLDHVKFSGGMAFIDDFKTTRNAHWDACARSIFNYDYHIQRAAYVDAIERLFKLHGRVRYRWIFAECKKPYAVSVLIPDGTTRTLGEALWRRAVDKWHHCTTNNDWPGYHRRTRVVEAPAYKMRELETYDDAA